MAKIMRPLTETPVNGSVDDEYFYRMLSPYALKLSEPYNAEESIVLEECLSNHTNIRHMNFIAVGGGELWELRRAQKFAKSYVCIEPLADIFINDSVKYLTEQTQNISFIAKKFGDVSRHELPEGNSFFMFLFNILAYIENPIDAINNIITKGDTLFITTWANTDEAKKTRTTYFQHLNHQQDEIIIDPDDNIGLAHLDNFPFDKLLYFSGYKRVKGKVIDVLIINT